MISSTEDKIRYIAFVSLGCPKNLVDSERMLGLLAEDGLIITNDPRKADAIVINTCGFLEAAKVESLQAIREAIQQKKTGNCRRLVVAGCLAQRERTQLLAEVPEIDRLVGVFDREHIVQAVRGQANPRQEHGQYLGKYHGVGLLQDDRARVRLTPRHYAYLRISEGCNQGCSFCTIPSIRGPMRSKPINAILREAKELASDGAIEINLIGQDTTSYGLDIDYRPGLSGLLRTLDKNLNEVAWLRLMYAYPSQFTDEMIRTIADCGRVVKYIDIPLQHINDEMLKRMRRRVTRREIETLLHRLRMWIPEIAIRTTFIAGAPGETETQHKELLAFVRDFGFEMMGVFPYSQERGTPMGRMEGQLPDEVKQRRVEELMLAQQAIVFARNRTSVGKEIQVLVDGKQDRATYVARSYAQAPEIDSTVLLRAKGLHAGQMVQVIVVKAKGYDLVGEMVKKRGKSLRVVR